MGIYKTISIAAALASAVTASPIDTSDAGLALRATNGKVNSGLNNVAYFNNANIRDGPASSGGKQYVQFRGDGTTGQGWPGRDKWIAFEDLFNINKNTMFSSCSWFGISPNDSGPEVGAVWNAVQKISQETGVDHRFVFATIMQESGGCVRVGTTNNGVVNPGLMQSHNGAGSCNRNGNIQNPCPDSVIELMVRDGTAGTSSGDGLAQCINQSNKNNVSDFYRAARIYNSGSLNAGDLNDPRGATKCYSSDIANRLVGWTGNGACSL